MDVDSEVEPTLQEMATRMAVMRTDLLPALHQLDEDTILSFFSVDEQARLYLSAAFTLALSLYSLDKITHRQVAASTAVAPRLTGAGTRHGKTNATAGSVPPATAAVGTTDTQLVLKIERITEYIKKLRELATLERDKKAAAAAAAAAGAGVGQGEPPAVAAPGKAELAKKRPRDEAEKSTAAGTTNDGAAGKKAKTEAGQQGGAEVAEAPEDDLGDAQMFSVVSRVAGEAGTLVSRLLKQVMTTKTE